LKVIKFQFQFESLMQLICLVCSSFKKVFKASITDLRTPPTPSTAAPTTTSATSTMGSTARTTSAEAAIGIRKDLDEVFEDELDDKRKTPDSLKEVLIVQWFQTCLVRGPP
jgi:hypothetical protein